MKMITVAGAHACGKTSVILKTAELLLKENCRPGVMKLDCISSEDDRIYSAAGITNVKYISGNICPDHYFADSISDIFQWGLREKLDLLITESAGLCGRCSPHIRDIPAVCVIDCLSGITAPQKIGPMLRYADFIAVTKGDLVSPAEREEFTQVFFDLLAASRAETLSELSQSWADSALAVAGAYAALSPAVRRDMLDYLWRFLVNMGTGGKG